MGTDEFTVSNGLGLSMTVSSFGARLVELQVPDKGGDCKNVVLGFDGVESYKRHINTHLSPDKSHARPLLILLNSPFYRRHLTLHYYVKPEQILSFSTSAAPPKSTCTIASRRRFQYN